MRILDLSLPEIPSSLAGSAKGRRAEKVLVRSTAGWAGFHHWITKIGERSVCPQVFQGFPGFPGFHRFSGFQVFKTNISQYAAGMISEADIESNPTAVIFKSRAPVCGLFLPYRGPHGVIKPEGKSTAASQIYPPLLATHIYINTTPRVLSTLTQATVLHEVLHNVTGMYDEDLEPWLGLNPATDCKNGTICITKKLVAVGCAGPN